MRFREEGGADKAREGLLGRAVGGLGVAQLCGSEVELRVLQGLLMGEEYVGHTYRAHAHTIL